MTNNVDIILISNCPCCKGQQQIIKCHLFDRQLNPCNELAFSNVSDIGLKHAHVKSSGALLELYRFGSAIIQYYSKYNVLRRCSDYLWKFEVTYNIARIVFWYCYKVRKFGKNVSMVLAKCVLATNRRFEWISCDLFSFLENKK